MNKDLISQTSQFHEVVAMIDNARARAFWAVNDELIHMHWETGACVSQRVKEGGWGKGTAKEKDLQKAIAAS